MIKEHALLLIGFFYYVIIRYNYNIKLPFFAVGKEFIMKKILSTLSLLLVCIMLCSCSAFQVKNISVIASVNGEDILLEEYNYFLLFAKQSILAGANATEDSKEFWTTTDIDGKNAADLAKENALDEAVKYTLIAQKAKAMGISLDTAEAKEQLAAALSNSDAYIKQYGLSKETMSTILEKFYLQSMLIQTEAEKGTLDGSEENVKKTYEENFRTIKHILFSLTDPETGEELYDQTQVYDSAKEAIRMINAGEHTFDEVMNGYSMDPGLASAPDGYTFTNNGTMVAPFEEAAFALEVGEMSEPVMTSYGCHVLKREALIPFETYIESNDVTTITSIIEDAYLSELITELKSQATIERNDKVFGKVDLY